VPGAIARQLALQAARLSVLGGMTGFVGSAAAHLIATSSTTISHHPEHCQTADMAAQGADGYSSCDGNDLMIGDSSAEQSAIGTSRDADGSKPPVAVVTLCTKAGRAVLRRAAFMAVSTNIRQTALYAVEDMSSAVGGGPVLLVVLRGLTYTMNSFVAAWQWRNLTLNNNSL
jgi:hypothetical protein